MSQSGAYDNTTILGDIELITGNAGGAVGPDALHNINIIGGGGVLVTGVAGTNTLTITSPAGGLPWTRIIGVAQAAAVNNGYIPTNVALTTITLPLVSAVGDIVEIIGEGAGLFVIAQNAGQNIVVDNTSTTVGVGGIVTPTRQYDCIKLVCRVANTSWSASSFSGLFNAL